MHFFREGRKWKQKFFLLWFHCSYDSTQWLEVLMIFTRSWLLFCLCLQPWLQCCPNQLLKWSFFSCRLVDLKTLFVRFLTESGSGPQKLCWLQKPTENWLILLMKHPHSWRRARFFLVCWQQEPNCDKWIFIIIAWFISLVAINLSMHGSPSLFLHFFGDISIILLVLLERSCVKE